MNLHEYQSREIFAKYGIPVPEGDVADTTEQALEIYNRIKKPVAIKAQVLVGGRGKAGGVKIARNREEVERYTKEILGMQIKGLNVKKVLVVEAISYTKEIYLGITIDRSRKKIVIIASPAGGIDIEEAKEIYKIYINPLIGLRDYQAKALAKMIEPAPPSVIFQLYQLFIENACTLAEINPMVLTSDSKLLACDAKIIIEGMQGEDPVEIEAQKYGLSYIRLDGNVACIVNGAGLAMATMDGIQLEGGRPANFLDVGGSSSPVKTLKALEIITANKDVRSILINIFGGITRCDDIAAGLIQAMKTLHLEAPVVVRLTGTNQDKAREMLKDTRLIFAPTMDEAIKKAVELAK